MSSDEPVDIVGAQVGDVITIPVGNLPMRPFIFADNCAIQAMGPGFTEVLLLRADHVLIAQEAVVVKADSGTEATMEMKGFQGRVQMVDCGRIRMTTPSAVDMAVAILSHVSQSGALEKSEMRKRLKTGGLI